MALYKKYYKKGLGIKYFPEDHVIMLEPKGISKIDLRSAKEKLETLLSVVSSNLEKTESGGVGFSIKLDPNTPENSIQQALSTMFHGGDEVQTAADMAQEEDEDNDNSMMQKPHPSLAKGQPGPAPMEGISLDEVYNILFESSYRRAKYWEKLVKPSGRGSKGAIEDKDVLSIRKVYSKKPKSIERDEVLRATDKALIYFLKKINKEQGSLQAEKFKEKFKGLDDLAPADYSEDGKTSSPESEDKSFPQSIDTNPESAMKVADIFSKQEDTDEEDYYQGFETR